MTFRHSSIAMLADIIGKRFYCLFLLMIAMWAAPMPSAGQQDVPCHAR